MQSKIIQQNNQIIEDLIKTEGEIEELNTEIKPLQILRLKPKYSAIKKT